MPRKPSAMPHGFNNRGRRQPPRASEPEAALPPADDPDVEYEADELAEMSDREFMTMLRDDIDQFKAERQPPVEPAPWERRSHVTPKPRRHSRLAVSVSWTSEQDPAGKRALRGSTNRRPEYATIVVSKNGGKPPL